MIMPLRLAFICASFQDFDFLLGKPIFQFEWLDGEEHLVVGVLIVKHFDFVSIGKATTLYNFYSEVTHFIVAPQHIAADPNPYNRNQQEGE